MVRASAQAALTARVTLLVALARLYSTASRVPSSRRSSSCGTFSCSVRPKSAPKSRVDFTTFTTYNGWKKERQSDKKKKKPSLIKKPGKSMRNYITVCKCTVNGEVIVIGDDSRGITNCRKVFGFPLFPFYFLSFLFN